MSVQCHGRVSRVQWFWWGLRVTLGRWRHRQERKGTNLRINQIRNKSKEAANFQAFGSPKNVDTGHCRCCRDRLALRTAWDGEAQPVRGPLDLEVSWEGRSEEGTEESGLLVTPGTRGVGQRAGTTLRPCEQQEDWGREAQRGLAPGSLSCWAGLAGVGSCDPSPEVATRWRCRTADAEQPRRPGAGTAAEAPVRCGSGTDATRPS